jgi:hypothetical protein
MCYFVYCDGMTLKTMTLRMWYIMNNFKTLNACSKELIIDASVEV